MIVIELPALAKRGESFQGSYSIYDDDALVLEKAKNISLILECSIVETKGSNILEEMQKNQQPNSSCNFSKYDFPLAVVYKNEQKFDGKLKSGQFSFQIPFDAPCTYKGKLLSIGWIIELKIDIPFSLDKNAFKELVVQ